MEERIATQALQQNDNASILSNSTKIAGNYSKSANLSLRKYSSFR
jgi:hypothetical protein